MRHYTPLILLTISFQLYGQQVKLVPSNPAPRIGERLTISFDLIKNNLDSLEIIDDIYGRVLANSMNEVASGTLEISTWFLTDPGPLSIGPFDIRVNGKVYRTTTLNINVNPKLPANIDRGIWIRLLDFDGDNFIIIEQRVPGKIEPTTNSDGRTIYSISTARAKWADLNIAKIERLAVEIEEISAASQIQPLDNGDALYMVRVYRYNLLDSFEGKFNIDKNLIIYLPDEGHFEVDNVQN